MKPSVILASLILLFSSPAMADGPRPHGAGVVAVPVGERVAWFGTLEAGLAEAKRTHRPIMLVAAVPHCHGVPGIW